MFLSRWFVFEIQVVCSRILRWIRGVLCLIKYPRIIVDVVKHRFPEVGPGAKPVSLIDLVICIFDDPSILQV